MHSDAQASFTTTGPYPAALHPQQFAGFPSNLSQPTPMQPMPHSADQGPRAASVAPTTPNRTEEASAPVVPSAKSLGKRRERNDSITERQPTKRKTNGTTKSIPAKVARSSSSSTSSSSENIAPSDGSGGGIPLAAAAAGQAQAPKGTRTRRKSKAVTSQSAEACGSGLSSMQTVFRATGPGFQPPNLDFTSGQVNYTLPSQQQQPPSHLPSSTIIAANGQPGFSQTQTDCSHSALPQPQQTNSDTPSSPRAQATPPIPLAADELELHKMCLAIAEVKITGNLTVLFPLIHLDPVKTMLTFLLRHAIQRRWVVRLPHPRRAFHFGPPSLLKTREYAQNSSDQVYGVESTSQAISHDGENAHVRNSSNVQYFAAQGPMQIIPQTDGGVGPSTTGTQSAADGNYAYTLAPQSDANSNQILYYIEANSSHQILHPTQSNHFEPSNEHSVGQPSFEGTTQPGIEAQHAAMNVQYHDEGPSDIGATTQPQPTVLPDSAYDLVNLTWDDILPQGMMTDITHMLSSLDAVTPDSMDPLNHPRAESIFLNIDGSEGSHPTADQSSGIPGASTSFFSATEESTVLESVGQSYGEFNLGDCGAIHGSTSNSDAQRESFVSPFKDAVSFNRALYGGYGSGLATLPFHMLGDYTDTMHILTPMMGQQEVVFEEQAREEDLDMSQFVDFNLEN